MEFKNMTIEEIEARKAEIKELLEEKDANLDELEAEVRSLNAELETRKNEEEKRVALRNDVANMSSTEGIIEESPVQEERQMTNAEVRNSKEYINAFASYIKTEDDAECRKLLTENVEGGSIPVPEFVYDIVKHAWDREGIFSRVKKSYLKGNLKIGFEISGDAAQIHTEGGDPINEENLVMGTVNLVPQTIKKYVSLSDEMLDTENGEQFLRYVYEELTYRIAKKAADILVGKIKAAGTASTTTAVGVPAIVATEVSQGLIAQMIGNLSDEAVEPVIIMNKLTWSAFKAAQYDGNFSADIFEGLPVEFNDTITAVGAASTGDTWLIVGDLANGALANLPAGNDIKFKFDDLTLATSDLIKVIGRMPVAIDLIGPKHFVKVTK